MKRQIMYFKSPVSIALIVIAISTFLGIQSCEQHVITFPEPEVGYESFSKTIQPILNKDCGVCHPGANELDLSQENAYASLTSGGYIDTENPESSPLYEKLQGSHDTYTSNANKEFILQWIKEGAKND